ncbi:prominin-2 [Amia ocellicauda]|uniref:prominin-2 n=1 Tax=Amia ocellicauda TaxID=2972642 RepID=UPI0034648AE1
MKRNNLSDLIEKGNKTFYDIPQTIRNQGKSMVDDILAALGAHGNTLMAFNQHLTELQILSNEISSVKKPIEQYGKQAQRYDFYRWAVALALCCLILLVVVLNILGLVLGSTGVHLRQHTDDDSVLAASGARLLMAGVGISFIFSWLFMLVVLVTFLVGGNIYTMGCRNWRNKEILLFLDNPRNLPEYLNISKLGMNFSISEVYNACEEGKSLYYSMHLDQFGFDFEVDKYVSKLNSIISGLSVNLTGVRLLSKKDKMRIFYLKNSHIAHINYTLMRTQLDKKVVQIDLLGYADRLSSAAQLQNDPSIRDKFEVEAMSIRELYNTTVRQQEADAQSMNASVAALSSISQTFKSTVDRALQSLSTTQTQIFTEGPLIVKNVTQCVVDQAINNLKQYLTWTKQTIITKVLSCLPLAVALDNVYTTVCVNTVDPWNAYWLCLGWCTVFLIPSAIFAVRTAKHFRPILRRPGDPFNTDNTFRIPKAKLRNPSVYANSNQNNGSNYNINLSQ